MSSSVVKSEARALVGEVGLRVALVGGSVVGLWVIHLVNALIFDGALNAYGVAPRTLGGLVGILFMPLLHGGWGHLIANTLGAPLAFLASERRTSDLVLVSIGSALSAGLGAWLFGAAGSVHVGASGVTYGYLGFVMGRGLFERRFVSVLLAGITTFLYGGLMMGVFPLLAGAGVSWQGHLFGWLGGFGMAHLLLSRRRPTKG